MTDSLGGAEADSGLADGAPIPSDRALIAQICQGQEQALALLYDRYGRLLYTIALRITGDRLTAEEVIQDVFYAVWQSAGGFHLEASVRGWLFGITRHRAIDATRRHQYRAHERTIALDALRMMPAAVAVEAQVVSLLDLQQVGQIIASLPGDQRQAIELAYYAGCTCAEIAVRTSTPLGTVKTRLRLGLLKVRALFGDEEVAREVGHQ